MDKKGIYVIIPAYNEASVLESTVAPLIAQGVSVVVVDDCSSDATPAVVSKLALVRIRHPLNLGQGAALQTGMDYCRRAKASAVVHFDADGQHDAAQLPELLEPIVQGRADIAFGSRFLRSSDLAEVPPLKRLALRIGRVVSGVLSGVWLTDTHNGYRALSWKALCVIQLRERGFAHATEILEQTRRAGLRYVEVPTTVRYSDYSKAKGQRISNGFNIVLDLILRRLSI